MTSVEELEICGIRSFDPNPANREVIRFSKPLTVILGKNGAGKTTIIECLLNATAGKFPPGCGIEKSSFVYDPKVYGEQSVKAQVRLKFLGRDGNLCRVIRSYEVNTGGPRKTSDKPKFVALETVISQKDAKSGYFVHGNFNASEADARLRELLGVSTAVLEHVIFCHQEDCNWPLGSASEVKSNFDAIFAATRYVAALDNLKENSKKYSRELKEYERTLIELSEHRAQAVELRDTIARREEEVRIIEMRNKGIEPQRQQLLAAAASIDAIRSTADGLTVESAQIEGRIHEKSAAIKRTQLPPTKQTLEELVDMRRNFDAHMLRLETDVQTKDGKLAAMEDARRHRSNEANEWRTKVGELHREAAQHKITCARLQEIVGSVTDAFVIGEAQLDEKALQRAQERIAQEAKKSAALLATEQSNHASEVAAVTANIDEVLRTMDADSKERELKERHVVALQQRCAELRQEIQSLAVTEGAVGDATETCAALQRRIEACIALREQGESFQEETKINRRIDEANQQLTALRLDIVSRKRSCAHEAQLPFLRSRVAERRAWVQEKLDAVLIPGLTAAGRAATTEASLTSTLLMVEQLRQQKHDAVRQAEREQTQMDRDVASLENQLRQRRQELAAHELELQRQQSLYVSAVGDNVSLDSFQRLLKEADDAQLKYCRHLSSIESMAKCYEGFVQVAKAEKQCVVCKRGLTDAALADFVKLNEDRQKTTPEQIEKARREMKHSQERLQTLKSVEGTTKEIARLEAAITEAKTSAHQLNHDVSTKKALLADMVNKRRELEAQMAAADVLFETGAQVNASAAEIQRLEKDIESITASKSTILGGAENKTMEELDDEYDALMSHQQSLSAQLQELQRRRGGGGDEFALQQELTSQRSVLLTLQAQLVRKKDVAAMLASAENERDDHKLRLAAIATRRAELQGSIDRLRASVDKLRASWVPRETQLKCDCARSDQLVTSMEAVVPSALKYIRGGMGEQLMRAKETLRVAEAAAAQTEEEIAALRAEAAKVRAVIGDQHRQFTNLSEHIRILELQKSLDDDRKRLEAVELELTNLKSTRLSGVESILGAQLANEPMQTVRDALQRKINELDRVRAQQDGNMEAMRRDLTEIQHKLSTDRYHNVDDRYSSVFIKLQTVELAVSDIEKYYKALDKAVQSYHQDKIMQVNAIIAELWRAIYRGSDIDTIELKSEVEGVSATAAGNSKRNYNYRVVMKRGNNEIDMRAKCSAGQKVLASVVIRVALSDAFSCECGILALDEPTTNLDEDNARSLAEALRDLIATRKGSKNFQLIVITHDEQFVRALGSQSVDRFYFVHKDREGAFSRVEEKSFDQLFA